MPAINGRDERAAVTSSMLTRPPKTALIGRMRTLEDTAVISLSAENIEISIGKDFANWAFRWLIRGAAMRDFTPKGCHSKAQGRATPPGLMSRISSRAPRRGATYCGTPSGCNRAWYLVSQGALHNPGLWTLTASRLLQLPSIREKIS